MIPQPAPSTTSGAACFDETSEPGEQRAPPIFQFVDARIYKLRVACISFPGAALSLSVVRGSPDPALRRPKVSLPFFATARPAIYFASMEAYQLSEEYSVYYITYSVVGWLPVFISEAP
ncbi:MAG: hypothetical protein HYV26_01000 [Candidatus Hydrogenedentes bacterium]|nr:hypothetical protein [Candidatus Hydrogenedentota bacterium]